MAKKKATTSKDSKPAGHKPQVVPTPALAIEEIGRRFIRLGELLTLSDSKLSDISAAAVACGLQLQFTIRK